MQENRVYWESGMHYRKEGKGLVGDGVAADTDNLPHLLAF